jgi:hypothetical protein
MSQAAKGVLNINKHQFYEEQLTTSQTQQHLAEAQAGNRNYKHFFAQPGYN